MTNYKEYWAYKELKDLGYKIKITTKMIEIRFSDGDLYERFDVEEFAGDYFVRVAGHLINDELEFTSSYDEIVCSILYYFHSRY